MASHGIEVLVSTCEPNGDRIIQRLSETNCTLPLTAKRLALSERAQGRAVTIRPTFNERDPETRESFYREWRSFNGGPFTEIRWIKDALRAKRRQVQDHEIDVPSTP